MLADHLQHARHLNADPKLQAACTRDSNLRNANSGFTAGSLSRGAREVAERWSLIWLRRLLLVRLVGGDSRRSRPRAS
jgi:hypothetical protein